MSRSVKFYRVIALISLVFLAPKLLFADLVRRQLGSSDRTQLVSDLSTLASMKMAGNPYPLGGFEGTQVILLGESLLGPLNNRIYENTNLPIYNKLQFAKGIYRDFDILASWMPDFSNQELSGYSLGLRWGFWEYAQTPLHFSLQGQFGFYRWQDQLTLQVQTVSVMGGYFPTENFNIYVGLGPHTSQGDFSGGPRSLSDSTQAQSMYFQSYQVMGGAALKIGYWLATLDLVLYPSPTLALGLGQRF